jgi:hypothetical protein
MGENVVPLMPDTGFKCTGGELPHGISKVWAKQLSFVSRQKVHFWLRHDRGYKSLCESVDAPAFLHNGQCPLFAPGNFTKCKKCMNLLRKGGAA